MGIPRGENEPAGAPLSRRERLREATIADIKAQAWAQLGAEGVTSLSLRAVARALGMTPSALYRYFASRDALLSELIVDGYRSLAEALEQQATEVRARPCRVRWQAVTRCYRAWALANPTMYALVFGTPVPGYQAPDERATLQFRRGMRVLFEIMIDGVANGTLDPEQRPVRDRSVRRIMREWAAREGLPLSPAAMQACKAAWGQLFGTVALEAYGRLPLETRGNLALFDAAMEAVLPAGV